MTSPPVMPPATEVRSLAEIRRVMDAARQTGQAVTLLSAPAAGLFAGCLWWREMIALARAEYPDVPMIDVIDCADGTAQAWAAARIGLRHIVLLATAPGRQGLGAWLDARGGTLLLLRPKLG